MTVINLWVVLAVEVPWNLVEDKLRTMMRFWKTMLLVLGLIVLVAFIGIMVYNVIEVNQLHAVAIANRSAGFDNPRNMMLIGSGLGLAAGLLLGLGIATPSRGFKARYADARKAEAISDAEAQGRLLALVS